MLITLNTQAGFKSAVYICKGDIFLFTVARDNVGAKEPIRYCLTVAVVSQVVPSLFLTGCKSISAQKDVWYGEKHALEFSSGPKLLTTPKIHSTSS